MATQNGTNYAKSANPSQSNRNDPGAVGGRVRSLTDVFTFAGEAAGEVINIGKDLVDGAIIHGVELYTAALGAGVTIDVGDSDTADRYHAAIDCTGVTVNKDLAQAAIQYVIGTNAGDNTIILTSGVGAATGEVKVVVYYSED